MGRKLSDFDGKKFHVADATLSFKDEPNKPLGKGEAERRIHGRSEECPKMVKKSEVRLFYVYIYIDPFVSAV
jgi:hypothetical protein